MTSLNSGGSIGYPEHVAFGADAMRSDASGSSIPFYLRIWTSVSRERLMSLHKLQAEDSTPLEKEYGLDRLFIFSEQEEIDEGFPKLPCGDTKVSRQAIAVLFHDLLIVANNKTSCANSPRTTSSQFTSSNTLNLLAMVPRFPDVQHKAWPASFSQRRLCRSP